MATEYILLRMVLVTDAHGLFQSPTGKCGVPNSPLWRVARHAAIVPPNLSTPGGEGGGSPKKLESNLEKRIKP